MTKGAGFLFPRVFVTLRFRPNPLCLRMGLGEVPLNSPVQSHHCESLLWGQRTLCLPPLTFHTHGNGPSLHAMRVGGQAEVGARILSGHVQPLRPGGTLPGAAHLWGRAT